jgi:predicted RNA-binding protein YlqC (UPF0109 family)
MGATPPKDVRELCEYLVLGLVDDPDAVKVTVEMTPYDMDRGRITFRHRDATPRVGGGGGQRPVYRKR